MSYWRNYKVLILIGLLLIGAIILLTNGLKYGLDFSGGTQFILTLNHPIKDSGTMDKVQTTISQRLDWTGLKDVKVSSWDQQFVSVQLAESDPQKIAQIEKLLQKQGKFESIFEGKVLFTGDDVVSVSKDPQQGYGIHKSAGQYQWTVPFTLNAKAARTFSENIFHKCVTQPDGTSQCPSTYFFIDRPTDSLVLIPKEKYEEEQYTQNNVNIVDVLKNANVSYIVFDSLDANTIAQIKDKLSANHLSKIVYAPTTDITPLKDLNLGLKYFEAPETDVPWIWSAVGLRTVIALNDSITNNNAPSIDSPNFRVYMNLAIEGSAKTLDAAQGLVNELSAILSSGSLPVGIENISKETVSPTLGKNILPKILLLGLLALLFVAIIIFIRYRDFRVALPIFITGASEVFLILAFASLIGWQLDLASLAGILAAVGTGVDDQIIITDELEKTKGRDEVHETRSLLGRVKRAFFIIWMSAATLAVTMLPVLFAFGGIPKLVGFAITTLAGVTFGVLVTRPAFAVILKDILGGSKK